MATPGLVMNAATSSDQARFHFVEPPRLMVSTLITMSSDTAMRIERARHDRFPSGLSLMPSF